MRLTAHRRGTTAVLAASLLVAAPSTLGALEPAAQLTLTFRQSHTKVRVEQQGLFGQYLGSGTGSATGFLEGTVGWDLYEDQSRDDLHPAHFHGFIEQRGQQHAFQIIGVFTPHGTERARTPDGLEHPRHWHLSGTIVFEDDTMLGTRQAPVTGAVDLAVWTGHYTVWVDSAPSLPGPAVTNTER